LVVFMATRTKLCCWVIYIFSVSLNSVSTFSFGIFFSFL
jgi:hypothetical protein